MTSSDRYASVLVALLEIIKQRGFEDADSDVAEFCNQLSEEAMVQARAWDISLEELGLDGLDPIDMLRCKAA